ncbi:hypothetical protein [Streptomyces pseudoechinosporeus]
MPPASPARLDYAEHAVRVTDPEHPALIAIDDKNGRGADWSWTSLRQRTAALAAHFRELGDRPGDRIVGYQPTIRTPSSPPSPRPVPAPSGPPPARISPPSARKNATYTAFREVGA